jgi:hypothetical protein
MNQIRLACRTCILAGLAAAALALGTAAILDPASRSYALKLMADGSYS